MEKGKPPQDSGRSALHYPVSVLELLHAGGTPSHINPGEQAIQQARIGIQNTTIGSFEYQPSVSDTCRTGIPGIDEYLGAQQHSPPYNTAGIDKIFDSIKGTCQM